MIPLYGGLEAGGTKIVCAVGSAPDRLLAETRFATTRPEDNLAEAIAFFEAQQARHGRLAAIGVGSFGPVDPDPTSPGFGFITSTPKPGWANVDVVGPLRRAFNVPVGFDTDVNAAALGEWRWGAAQGLDNFVYLTVGTGIGGGALVNGRAVHGLLHPEMGHSRVPHDRQADPFPGFCTFHGDCLEGLAAGPALELRWGQRGETLPREHPAWALEAHYLAHGLANFVCILSPQRVILGGGVMEQTQLLPLIRAQLPKILNGYIQAPSLLDRTDEYVVAPALGGRSGVFGAIVLAELAAEKPAA
jgi:fructokinase